MFVDLSARHPEMASSLKWDRRTFILRYQHEGVSFATKTLPKLGKALDQALETRTFECPPEFETLKGTAIPRFLGGMLNVLFDPAGSLVHEDVMVVQSLRQLLFLVYKMEFPYTRAQELGVVNAFLETERDIQKLSIDAESPLIREARIVIASVLIGFNPFEIVPKHGPGSVATGEYLEDKWEFSRLYENIHRVYPYYDYFVAGGSREVLDRLEWFRGLDRQSSGCAKVVLVPKDSRGPRLISCEPLEYQWIQQGLGRALMHHLESNRLSMGNINFRDQTVNRLLARQSSIDGEYATLDLSEASDRVSLKLVRTLFDPWHLGELAKGDLIARKRYESTWDYERAIGNLQRFLPALEATRSSHTRLPSGEKVELLKFAPMGSALCFPVEALIFWALCVAAIRVGSAIPMATAGDEVKVYGDDLIVPTAYFDNVVGALESVGLLVNRSKSFHRGNFRESCGLDALSGVDVTPTRVKTLWSGKSTDSAAYASYISYANEFSRRGYKETARLLWEMLEFTYGEIPFVGPNSSLPGVEVSGPFSALQKNLSAGYRVRWNEQLQSVEVRGKYLSARRGNTRLDGWSRLLRYFSQGAGPEPDVVVHPRSTQIQTGWRRL
jgi:hypothetical protein